MHVNVLASGESMSQSLADSLRGQECIVVSNCFELAPWAWALCAQDLRWWLCFPQAKSFAGRKFSCNKITGVEQVDSPLLQKQSGSGVLGLERAWRRCEELGYAEIRLHGYNNRGTHYFGPHTSHKVRKDDRPDSTIQLLNTSASRYREFETMLATLGIAIKKAGIRVVNYTPNSALRCFEMN